MTDTPRLGISVNETARLLGVAEITVRRLIRAGKLPAFRVGRLVKIRRSAIAEFRDKQAIGR